MSTAVAGKGNNKPALASREVRSKRPGLKIKLYADGADKEAMLEMYANPLVSGFTTNPTLMRKSGVSDYRSFAREILQLIPDRVVSVRGVAHKRVWHDVTNADQSSIHLHFAQGQEAEFLHSDIAAALKPKWYILGERGAIVGHWRQEVVKTRRWSGDLIEERLAASESLPNLSVFTRTPDGAVHEQQIALPTPPTYPCHTNLANHLHYGTPLAVPPEEARRNIAVMEAAKRSIQLDGKVIMLND